jgi:hypothetical protein
MWRGIHSYTLPHRCNLKFHEIMAPESQYEGRNGVLVLYILAVKLRGLTEYDEKS